MKLTPLDIHHKEFHHALRGYSEEEVDKFLDEVAEEFERLFKENIDLSEKLEAASAKVRDYQSMEVTLNNTMVSAQRASEQIVAQANQDASMMLREAEVKAKEIIHSALMDKQKAQTDLVRIKEAEGDFRSRFQALLEKHLSGITEISLPPDVQLMVGETRSGAVSEVSVDPATEVGGALAEDEPPLVAVDDVEGTEPSAEPEFVAEALVGSVADDTTSGSANPVAVESMTFGELESLDIEDDFDEPKEFSMPSLDAFGERDDDVDIEEID